MARYVYICDSNLSGCGRIIEFECLISELDELKPKSCPVCKKRKSLHQFFSPPTPSIPKTLGSLADKNHAKMSDDEKHHILEKNNAYRKSSTGRWHSTPEGIVHD